MFGWLKRRQRREHIKLLEQNRLAAEYMLGVFRSSQDAGLGDASEYIDNLNALTDAAMFHSFILKDQVMLPDNVVDFHMMANSDLRKMFAQTLSVQKLYAKRYGHASERIESFDSKFMPNEGWKIFIDHAEADYQ